VPKLAPCVLFDENTLHPLKPVFLDMSNYTDDEQKVTRQHLSPLARFEKRPLAFSGISILHCILEIIPKFFAFCKGGCTGSQVSIQ
jgi:hypothetical protein